MGPIQRTINRIDGASHRNLTVQPPTTGYSVARLLVAGVPRVDVLVNPCLSVIWKPSGTGWEYPTRGTQRNAATTKHAPL